MDFKVLLGNDKIDAIKQSFDDSIMGLGFALSYDVTIEAHDADTSYISFKHKMNSPVSEVSISAIFQYGMMIGRDYLQDPDYYKWKETVLNLNKLYEQKK